MAAITLVSTPVMPTNTQLVPANPSSQAGRNSTPQVGQPVTVMPNQSIPATVAPRTPTTTSRFFCVNSNTPVLLQTAQAYIHRQDDRNCGISIRLIL